MSDKPISPLRQRMIDDMTARPFSEKVQKAYVRQVRTFAAFLGRSRSPSVAASVQRAARAAPRGQPERPAEAHTEGMVRAIAASRGAGSDQRPPRPAPEATSTRGQRPTTSGHRQRTLSATSAGKVICSPFSVEGFPSRASVEGEHGETGLSLHRTMLSEADGGP